MEGEGKCLSCNKEFEPGDPVLAVLGGEWVSDDEGMDTTYSEHVYYHEDCM